MKKQELLEMFKSEAMLALNEFGKYRWQYEELNAGDPVATIENVIYFMEYYGFEEITTNSMMSKILSECDGKNSKNAKSIAIDFMSDCIAHWESSAFSKRQ